MREGEGCEEGGRGVRGGRERGARREGEGCEEGGRGVWEEDGEEGERGVQGVWERGVRREGGKERGVREGEVMVENFERDV